MGTENGESCSQRDSAERKGLGLPEWEACEGAYSRKSYWRMSNTGVVKRALTKERLINWGFYDLATAYQSVHVNY